MNSINIKKISTALLIFICVLALSAGSASYGHISSHGQVLKDVKETTQYNGCQKYLQQASYIQPQNTTFKAPDARAKSKAAAVGILFGARYVLGSASVNKQGGVETGKMNKVMAIKNYRNCQKEQALKG